MRNVYTSAGQLIGGTPLLELARLEREEGLESRLLAKLEFLNPAGSVKDRVAKAMLDDAEARGLLRPATPASAWPPWPPPGDTGWSSSCRRP